LNQVRFLDTVHDVNDMFYVVVCDFGLYVAHRYWLTPRLSEFESESASFYLNLARTVEAVN